MPQEDAAREGSRCRRAAPSTTSSAVRAIADVDAAARAVALDGERAPVAPLPGRAQRVREQRQRAGLGGDVAQDQLDEAGLEPQAGEPCRLRDGARELVVGHRAEQDLVGGDRGGEVGVRAEPAVEVGAHADRDARRAAPAARR